MKGREGRADNQRHIEAKEQEDAHAEEHENDQAKENGKTPGQTSRRTTEHEDARAEEHEKARAEEMRRTGPRSREDAHAEERENDLAKAEEDACTNEHEENKGDGDAGRASPEPEGGEALEASGLGPSAPGRKGARSGEPALASAGRAQVGGRHQQGTLETPPAFGTDREIPRGDVDGTSSRSRRGRAVGSVGSGRKILTRRFQSAGRAAKGRGWQE